ncbi:MAG TPA: phosphatase PAP2 family protein [Streptosporangiaceae bacterium]|nr:phosphatase PAP2 family protein [Streptosporangiaceae bacterium]
MPGRGEWRQPLEHPQRAASRPLVPAAMRSLAAAILAGCAAVTVLLGTLFAHQTRAGPLDAWVDARIRSGLGGQRTVLNDLSGLGDLMPVAVLTAVLVLACLLTRRWRGAVLVAVAVPAAASITEFVLKPLIGRTLLSDLSFPSGNETRVFAVAAAFAVLLADPPRARIPAAARVLLALAALLVAGAVGVALVGLGHHYFTDTVGGAAVGVAVVLATAFILDRPWPWTRGSRPGPGRPTAAPAGPDSPAAGHRPGQIRQAGFRAPQDAQPDQPGVGTSPDHPNR